jgi:hypothetical protein
MTLLTGEFFSLEIGLIGHIQDGEFKHSLASKWSPQNLKQKSEIFRL